MNEDAASLSRLHDLVEPPPPPWWPPAPGWWILGAFVTLAALWLLWRAWAHWRANAYRREALQELATADTVAGVSEVLRRTALVVAPRSSIASLTGAAWPAWLAEHAPSPMPDLVSRALTTEAYRPEASPKEISALREYAAEWIRGHAEVNRTTA